MSEFNLKSGNATPFKLMGSSPCKDCAEDPTGKGCGGNFKVNKRGNVISRFLKKTIVDPIKKSAKNRRVRRSNKEYNKRTDNKSNSKTSNQSPRTLSTSGEGGSDYTGV